METKMKGNQIRGTSYFLYKPQSSKGEYYLKVSNIKLSPTKNQELQYVICEKERGLHKLSTAVRASDKN